MNNRIVKPLALAVGLAMCTGALAAPGGAFDIKELDTGKDVCNDFNGFVNAKWIAANPIPADRTRWGSFDALREGSLDVQHAIVEKAAKGTAGAKAGSIEQKIGYFYASGMDEAAIEKAGFEPIKPELARIGALKNSSDIVAYITDSYAHGNPVAFRFYGSPDFKNSNNQIAYAGQGGLGLPTADYYSKPDFEKIRTAYVAHVARTLQLVGVGEADAQAQAKAVMAFETRLASASLVPTELRQPENRYHYVSITEADKVTPHFDWAAFFKAQGADVQAGFSLSQPKFFAEFDRMLAEVPVADWQAYLRFHAIDEAAPYLSTPFQTEDFAFNAQTLNGQKEMKSRWKRTLDAVEGGMGMALGQLYVAQTFSPESKAAPRNWSPTCARPTRTASRTCRG
jgi:putative endopeptidase